MQTTLRHLAAWMPQQRWYTPTGGEPRLRVLAERRLSSSAPDVDVQLLIVGDGDDADTIVYQVPLVWRPRTGEPEPSHTVGVDDDRLLVDGPHDPAFTAALLVELGRPDLAGPASVLTGEQSNTSVIFRPSHAAPVICKVFRRLHPGINPDIELQSALAAAGSAHVPPVIGHLDGEWTSTAPGEPAVRGSLAFAQEFLPDVEDAWRVALAAAAVSADFSAEAQSLGRATADVHRDLAHLFPTPPADADARRSIVAAWRRRLSIAVAEVPALGAFHDAVARIYARAEAAPWPHLQRVHGDYHLGQVLHSPTRGWMLLDFEGEPMRPISERRAPDLALRDIAGMLRSFDYVAGSLRLQRGPHQLDATADAAADAWALAARTSFLTGYGSTFADPSGALLDALELDKAVYEAIYEARHRPAWLAIPLAAVARLVTR
ncbi:aminoglycoside phosphotransferase [Microbacterium hominis]|uniref:maltokinase N-terminal cap-like domain-containing protein n=1 Tax=Microbacterium hominis TaxID=162426 RepID=UPI0019635760|nr:aminoglycoside phosphotransferase [Microbacterium hominis]QRY40801.1 aminoglycoside phosphotransferase [Microbacterium hominis]